MTGQRLFSGSQRATQPVVSICLPVRDGVAFLAQAIESVLAQSFGDFEVLISDDASTDGSADIISQYAKQDKRILWQRNAKSVGLFNNYNICLERSVGDYLKPFAQDDIFAPDLLRRQVEFLKLHSDVALVAAGRTYIDSQGKALPDLSGQFNLVSILGSRPVYATADISRACLLPLVNLIGEPCAVMFPKEHRGYGFSSVFRHAGDLEYWLRILQCGNFGMVHEPLVSFRKHEASATANNLKQLWVHTDILHMSGAMSRVLHSLDCPVEQFIEHNLTFATRYVPRLSNGLPDLSAIVEDDEYQPSDVAALKRTLLFSLAMIAESDHSKLPAISEELRELSINALKIENEEMRLRSLLRSFSWRSTRLFREVRRIFCSLKAGDDLREEDFKQGPALVRQREYLRYLRNRSRKILVSRSWKITRLFRNEEHEALKLLGAIELDAGGGASLGMTQMMPQDSIQSLSAISVQSNPSRLIVRSGKNSFCDRPYDLILAVHEARRSGAPMVALTLCKHFAQRGLNILVVLKSGGPLLTDFNQLADVLDLSHCLERDSDLSNELTMLGKAGKLSPQTPIFLNSAELYDFARVFKWHGGRLISLIHEYLSNYPRSAAAALLASSDCAVFSSQASLDNAVQYCGSIKNSQIIPQGLLEPGFGKLSPSSGKDFLFRNYGIAPSSFVVLACGNSDQRKGIDIFTLVAGDMLSGQAEALDIQFVWVGGEPPNTYDSYWWATYDIKQRALENRVHFVAPQANLEPFFAGSDLFLLCSRQDPMPCVLHLAQAARLPVVAFENSGGASEVIAAGGGKLVPYGNIKAASGAITEYYGDRSACEVDGAIGQENVHSRYQIKSYVDSLLSLAMVASGDFRRKQDMVTDQAEIVRGSDEVCLNR